MDKVNRQSRLSLFPRYAPRESMWTTGNPEVYRDDNAVCSPFLKECVAAMEDCCDETNEAQELLRQGSQDLPRISKVLDSDRVFLLVGESTVRKYKDDITDEIEPQIRELLSRAQKGLGVLVKRENLLHTKVESVEQSKQTSKSSVNTAGMTKLEARRVQMLVRQRERLEEELAVLQREVDNLELSFAKKR